MILKIKPVKKITYQTVIRRGIEPELSTGTILRHSVIAQYLLLAPKPLDIKEGEEKSNTGRWSPILCRC